MRFDGKIVVVTGGASGIGLATCQQFAKAGAQVVLTDIDAKKAAVKVEEITAAGGKAVFLELDITNPASVEAALAAAFLGAALRFGLVSAGASTAAGSYWAAWLAVGGLALIGPVVGLPSAPNWRT